MRDTVFLRDLLVRGILGLNPDERENPQDILVNVAMEVDTRAAAASDDIDAAVNYRSVAKRIIARVESGDDLLVEKLVNDLAAMILADFPAVERVRVRVEKPGAVRFARSVGVEVERRRGGREGREE